jgi:hypothetical protein
MANRLGNKYLTVLALSQRKQAMRKRTVKLWRLQDDGRKLAAGTIEAADPRELVMKWSLFLAYWPNAPQQKSLIGYLILAF